MVKASVRTEKNNKRKRIYQFAYQNKVTTRPEIASALKISLPTATQYVQELLDEGLLEEIGNLDSTVGRKPVALRCNPTAKCSVGLSLSLKHISGVIVNLFGEVMQSQRIAVDFEDSEEYRTVISRMVSSLVSSSGVSPESVLGVMISVPGTLTMDQNEISFSHVFPIGLTCESLTANIPYQCAFCNDANAAGFTEIWNSAPRSNAVYLSLNETVGGAVLMDRKIYSGMNNRSGEFGHISIARDGPLCRCGKRGCISCFCSSSILARHYDANLEDFFFALKRREQQALADFDEYLEYLSLGIDVVRSMLDCDIVVGGEVGEHIAPYIDQLQSKVRQRNSFHDDSVFVYPSQNRRMASAVGAALLLIPPDIGSLADCEAPQPDQSLCLNR